MTGVVVGATEAAPGCAVTGRVDGDDVFGDVGALDGGIVGAKVGTLLPLPDGDTVAGAGLLIAGACVGDVVPSL